VLEHGKPLIFGKNRDKGIRMNGHRLEVATLGNGITEDDLLVHDEQDDALAFLLSTLQPPKFPAPIGVFRAIQRATYDHIVNEQIRQAAESRGTGDLDELFSRGDTWEVA
jgi:2-oxoglutarate ferredoxin oxidoreductase subunit beta